MFTSERLIKQHPKISFEINGRRETASRGEFGGRLVTMRGAMDAAFALVPERAGLLAVLYGK